MSEEEAIKAAIADAIADGSLADVSHLDEARIFQAARQIARPSEAADTPFMTDIVKKVAEAMRG